MKVVVPTARLGTRSPPCKMSQSEEILFVVDKPVPRCDIGEAVDGAVGEYRTVTGPVYRGTENHFDVAEDFKRLPEPRGRRQLAESGVAPVSHAKLLCACQEESDRIDHAELVATDCGGEEEFALLIGGDQCISETLAIGRSWEIAQMADGFVIVVLTVPAANAPRDAIVLSEEVEIWILGVETVMQTFPDAEGRSNQVISESDALQPAIGAFLCGAETDSNPGGLLAHRTRGPANPGGWRQCALLASCFDSGKYVGRIRAMIRVATNRSDRPDEVRKILLHVRNYNPEAIG